MNQLENIQVIDRAWPAPKTLTREAMADELVRCNLYRPGDWVRKEDESALRDVMGEVMFKAFREKDLTDTERMIEVRACITNYVEAWAERQAEECE